MGSLCDLAHHVEYVLLRYYICAKQLGVLHAWSHRVLGCFANHTQRYSMRAVAGVLMSGIWLGGVSDVSNQNDRYMVFKSISWKFNVFFIFGLNSRVKSASPTPYVFVQTPPSHGSYLCYHWRNIYVYKYHHFNYLFFLLLVTWS